MSDLTRLSAAVLAEKLAAREVSSVEATKAHLDRIAAVDGDIHAFLHVSDQQVLRGRSVGEWVRSRQHLPGHHAPRVEIGTMISEIAGRLLRRHVRWCP